MEKGTIKKNEMLDIQKHAIEYLESKGWGVAVIGEVVIQHQPSQLKFNNELVIKFTGNKK
jgi:hypothetical protein